MKRTLFDSLLSLALAIAMLSLGYWLGKRVADIWYHQHPVTLIQPLKWRASEPVASLEELR